MEERKMKLVVEPMLPTRVNRYWLEGRDALPSFEEKKLTGRKAKKAKVELVASLLKEAKSSIGIAQSLEPFVAEFVLSCNKAATGKRTAVDGTSKLDDLADSLLQGLAFISWQNSRERIKFLGQDAIDMELGTLLRHADSHN
jgi:hypothetical protein